MMRMRNGIKLSHVPFTLSPLASSADWVALCPAPSGAALRLLFVCRAIKARSRSVIIALGKLSMSSAL